jgi:tyrosine-protein phosphatase 2/3
MESNPDFEAFRRQSEKGVFSLNSSFSNPSARPTHNRTNSAFNLAHPESPISPGTKRPQIERSQTGDALKKVSVDQKPYFDIPRQQSPISMTPRHSLADDKAPRLSLPFNELHASSLHKVQSRADTLPHSHHSQAPGMVNPKLVAELLQEPDDVLLLDLRVYQQYAVSRIHGSLNLCIPTTLIKRPAFTTQKLADTFSREADRDKFEQWQRCKYIVVYDACSSQPKEAVIPFNVLKKFEIEGWKGTGYVVKGGFLGFAKMEPTWVDKGAVESSKGSANPSLSISSPAKDVLPVAGGCFMPSAKSSSNAFFGNIRQNMDLLDGVGQMPVKKPHHMSELSEHNLPGWLRAASRNSDEGKRVSERFLSIEKSEQKRMQQALGGPVCYAADTQPKGQVQVAGIEKGSKNRYNNIFPFNHTRVRLQNVAQEDCDYINASHVKAEYSNRRYIATQAPIPATFGDFWRVVWEQDARVIVMLTAESEGGQVKSHPYWKTGEYGRFKVKMLSERQISLESNEKPAKSASLTRPTIGQRRSTANNLQSPTESNHSPTSESPSMIVRTFTLSHSSYPFQPIREVTQVHYSQWPDLGTALPTDILGLIEQVNTYIRGSASPQSAIGPEDAAREGERPIVVHCSAGCGRTGTYCTIDSVIDMLKRQKLDREGDDGDRMEIDTESWIKRDDEDLVSKTVDDFRHQRLSMVQNLRQFVLCYESILQWVVSHQPENIRSGKGHEPRRSYQG